MPELSTTTWIVLAGAAATYLTRIGGHLILSQFRAIPPRVEAALNAVPAAVLTTLVAPAAVFEGTAESLTLLVAFAAAFHLPMMGTFAVGWIAILVFRAVLG
ncbi:AzlD family protein [Oricola cellulosilytica]|uniref:AzlD family protein n=1 Tax=Oricola cellulosilytica TaxID=1429082 RepID=A0A4R0PF05_9HYPH|nr:AzlD family protein [Oricola cellulosilytica]TCD15228.1 AzlD family protein [Oricola cellulosilytica]